MRYVSNFTSDNVLPRKKKSSQNVTTRTLLLVDAIETHTFVVMFSFITFRGKPLDLDLSIVLCLLDFYTILKSDNIIHEHC